MTTVQYQSHRRNRTADGRRYFTPAEANRALVFVKRVTADIVREYSRLLDLHEIIEAAAQCGSEGQYAAARDEMIRTAEKLHHCMEELEAVGVELKDWADGIIDFPCLAGGREVRLCWCHGEQAVSHWHEPEEGFAQRRPVEQLEAWELLAAQPGSAVG